MVSFSQVQASNAGIAAFSSDGLVAVFVGATSGIGEYSIEAFAQTTRNARIYMVGRSQQSAERIIAEIASYKTGAKVTFVQADVSLIKNVDHVCKQIQAKEPSINLLFLSQGNAQFTGKTEEGLVPVAAVGFFGRLRFIHNFLPQLQAANGLRRVVTVLAGTKEGAVYPDDLQGSKVPLTQARGHLTAATTLSLEALAQQAPTVSFIHTFPGFVRGNLLRGSAALNAIGTALLFICKAFNLFGYVEERECGQRHVFLATSARFPPAAGDASGVPLVDGVEPSVGSTGERGSGVYIVDERDEAGDAHVVQTLAAHRKKGYAEQVFGNVQKEWARITRA